MDIYNVLQLGSMIPSILFFFFKIVLYSSSSAFPYILESVCLYLQKSCWDFYWNYVKSTDQYGKNLLFLLCWVSDP